MVIRAVIVVGLLSGLCAPLAVAQQKGKATKAKGAPGWSVNCASTAEGLRCQALQSVFLKKTRQRIVTAAVSVPPKAKQPVLLLHLAHGILLPAGVDVQVDKEKAKKLVVQFCDPKGCYARLPIAEPLLKAMKNGRIMTIGFQNLAKQPIKLELSLNSFTAAYGKIKKRIAQNSFNQA